MGNERRVLVSPERLTGWIERFEGRHGSLSSHLNGDSVRVEAADGAVAAITVPFPPIALNRVDPTTDLLRLLIEHTQMPRTVGAILVRRGGYAAGVFSGTELVASKVGSGYVQGTTKAGGWSQQRYARRRANQTAQAYADAAHVVLTHVLPRLADLDAVVGGGDRAGVDAVLSDPHLARLREIWTGEVWPTVDPRLRVLKAFPGQFRSVTMTLNDLA